MLMGCKFQAYPTSQQKEILSQWMGGGKIIWNAKCEQYRYERTFALKFLPIGTYPTIDQTYAQFKNYELTPYLFDIPSQVLRNSAANWYNTMQNFLKGINGCAKIKKKNIGTGSVHLTNELFKFVHHENGKISLMIGTKKFPIGELKFKAHREFTEHKSIHIKKNAGQWWVSFCYDDNIDEEQLISTKEYLKNAKNLSSEDELDKCIISTDRGIKVAVQTPDESYTLDDKAKKRMKRADKKIKRLQKKLARQDKDSNARKKTKIKIAKNHKKKANIVNNFCHQTSNKLTKDPGKIIVMENLKIKQMTKRAKPVKDDNGKWLANKAKQKSGLNEAILSIGWYKLENYTRYKAIRRGCCFIKISPYNSSNECANCGHIHPDNRKTQANFACVNSACGNINNADINAALVLKKRAIKLIKQYFGAELSEQGVLWSSPTALDIGCGANSKTSKLRLKSSGLETSKMMGVEINSIPEASTFMCW
jgi:putative transposase